MSYKGKGDGSWLIIATGYSWEMLERNEGENRGKWIVQSFLKK
jgi:hypothetical protein